MIPDFLKQFNWVDLVTLVFLVRGIYQGAKGGLIVEFFSLAGWFLSVFFAFKFYKPLAELINKRTEIPLVVDEIVVFAAIVIAVIIIARLAGAISGRVIKIKLVERLNRVGGAIFGAVRAAVVLSIIFYALGILSIPYLKKSVEEKSLSGKAISKVSEVVYKNIGRMLD